MKPNSFFLSGFFILKPVNIAELLSMGDLKKM